MQRRYSQKHQAAGEKYTERPFNIDAIPVAKKNKIANQKNFTGQSDQLKTGLKTAVVGHAKIDEINTSNPADTAVGSSGSAPAASLSGSGTAANPNSNIASTFLATRYAFAAPPFGQVAWNRHNPAATYTAWVDGSNWRFRLASLALRVPVGIASGGRTNIPSATNVNVTSSTWRTVESDLRPAGGTPNRSPRTTYWAEDLTWKHEIFHFDEFNTFLRTSFTAFETQIEGTSYTDAHQSGDTEAIALARKQTDLNTRLTAAWNQAKTNMSPGMENRAYADGDAVYTARADAVQQRAVTEGW